MKTKVLSLLMAAVILFGAMTVPAAAQTKEKSYNLTTVSGITAAQLAKYMHPETRHLAGHVVRICEREGVSAEFVAAVMRWERRPDLHNYFGWTNYRGRLMRFENDVACLERVIPLIKKCYLTPNGKYFNGYTVEAVSIYYNNSEFWRDTIKAETIRILESERKCQDMKGV